MKLDNPLFTGIAGKVENIEDKSVENLIGSSGLNTGNFLFVSALRNLLGQSDSLNKRLTSYKRISDLSDYSYIAISAANWINRDTDQSVLADFIEKTDLPCLLVGIGAQAGIGERVPKLKEGTKRFLKIVSERSRYISVRGAFTQEVLDEYGIHNTWVTGCPSVIGTNSQFGTIPTSYNVDKLNNVVIQGTRHGLSDSIFKNDHLSKLNIELYRYAYASNRPLLLQSEVPDIYCCMKAKFLDDKEQAMKGFLEKVYGAKFDKVRSYLENKSMVFWDLDSWFAQLSSHEALIGTRIHGVVSALLAGIPAVLLVHDERTIELAKTLNIPYRRLSEAKSINDKFIRECFTDVSYSSFHARLEQYRVNFRSFFDANNISHTL